MREIKFRGKRIDNGKWVYGVPITNSYGERVFFIPLLLIDKIAYPFERLADWVVEVDKKTIAQYTGFKDKNDIELYVDSIVRHSEIATDISVIRLGEFGVPNMEEMEYQDMAVGFYFENASDLRDVEPFNMTIPLNTEYVKNIKVIGSIYENSELLEVNHGEKQTEN